MAEKIAVRVENVHKEFKLPHEKNNSIKSLVLNFYKARRSFERQKVLKGISFEVKEGEFFGVVGRNGSGKSTLLKLLAGIYLPNEGTIEVNGKLTPFIELGVGFNMELTGRENVYLNGALLGFSHKEMDGMYDDIVVFAELGKFMDQKLKNYSSGMQVRLAFSIAIRARSDVLLIDEVLAVGDARFQQKCFNYFKELKKYKKTVILVSHDANALQQYCDRGILIDNGEIISKGNITRVVNDYLDILNAEDNEETEKAPAKHTGRWGTGNIEVSNAKAVGHGKTDKQIVFTDQDATIDIVVSYKAKADVDAPVYGISIMDAAGQMIFQSNTLWSKIKTHNVVKGESITITWEVPNIFNDGEYSVAPAAADYSGTTIFDWYEDGVRFKIRKILKSSAHANVEHKIVIDKAK